MIVGCKKTLVEYRGWINSNRYYLRIPIRMGGLFSRNDFVQRLTRPEYFPIATSPQNPTPKPFLTIHSQIIQPHTHTSPPQIPHKIISLSNPTPKTSPNSPILTHTHPLPSFYLHFFQKTPKFPINSTKSNQKSLIYPKISPKSTKFTPKNTTNFPIITHLYLKTVAKTPF